MAYLRLRFRAFTVGAAEYTTMFPPRGRVEVRRDATQRDAGLPRQRTTLRR